MNKEKLQLTEIKTKYAYIYTGEMFEEVVEKIKKAFTEKVPSIMINEVRKDEEGNTTEEIITIYILDIIRVDSTYEDECGFMNRKRFGDVF